MRKILLLSLMYFVAFNASASIPSSYYNNANGKSGISLQSALHDIIDNHKVISYDGLISVYHYSDVKENGTLWDIYSDNPNGEEPYEYTLGTKQCGNYKGEGDCYNREHTFPQSWFGKKSPMVSDLIQVLPTDGYVNGRRSSFPYGEVDNPKWTSMNGSQLGPNTTSGYSGTVFEPIDEYKGDLARIYFYMATRYYGEDASWGGSDMFDGSQPEDWAIALLLKWHNQDPVSTKEISRNDIVYQYQENRNPFVDHPEYACAIWGGNNCDTIVDPGDTTIVDPGEGAEVVFINMSTSHYQYIVDYVKENDLPNSSHYVDSEYYYGASAKYSNFDMRSGKQYTSFTDADQAIESCIIDVILPHYASDASVDNNYQVYYDTYDGSVGNGSMTFNCTSIDPLAFSTGIVTNLDNSNYDVEIKVYPNPSSLSIQFSEDIDALQIVSASGICVMSFDKVESKQLISIIDLSSGVYFMKVRKNGTTTTQKLIKSNP